MKNLSLPVERDSWARGFLRRFRRWPAWTAVRSYGRARKFPAGAVPVEGDLLEAHSLKQAIEGVSAIVHLAAVFFGLKMRMPSGGLISMARNT